MGSSRAGYLPARSWWAAALVLALLLLAVFYPRETPAKAEHLCASTGSIRGPFNVVAYEAKDWRQVYGDALTLAGFNNLFPGDPFFGLPPIERGPRNGRGIAAERYIPPALLKAIGWIESSWIQARFDVPYGAIGPTLVSHDCGYGIMQVTSGMQNTTGTPTPQQLMVAAHYAYNIARGAWILADKWNAAPEFRPIVGDGDPRVIEDWYYAIWSYNGFAFVNHPLNPAYSQWPRTPYSCGPASDGFGHDRSQYPYQELAYGCLSRPPSPVLGAGPLWPPLAATLPDLSAEEVFKAMDIANFLFNEERMDIPRPQPSHNDPTLPSSDPRALIGAPRMVIAAPNLAFQLFEEGSDAAATPVPIALRNSGTGLLVWMAVPSQPWIVVTPAQGIALGAELGGGSSTFIVLVDTRGLEPGRYQGTVTVSAPFAADAPTVLNVQLTLQDRSFAPGVGRD